MLEIRLLRSLWVRAALLCFLMLLCASAGAQSGGPVPSVPSEAQAPEQHAEDPQERAAGPFRLHDALGAPDWLTVNGSQRTRYEGLLNQFRPGLDENDQALALRTLLTLGVTFGPVSVVGELQDSRAYLTDENSAVSTIVVNAVEPLQAYVELSLDDAPGEGDTLDLRAGRQTMDVGSQRLIARQRFRNTIQSYTGISSRWQTRDGSELLAFAVLPVRVEPDNSDLVGLLDNRIELDRESFDLTFVGGFSSLPLGLGSALEAYIFVLNERDGRDFETRNRQLYTPGLRFVRLARDGAWDADLENVLQVGTRRATPEPDDTLDHEVLAHFHHASVGYTFDVPWSPQTSAELDYASGDDATTQGRYERFDSLFGPRRAEFGPTDIYGPLGRENIISAGLRVVVEPTRRLDGNIAWRANWLADSTDAFARTGVADSSGQSGRFAGNQIEMRIRLWVIPDSLRWEVGGAAFVQGRFMRDAPNATGNGDPLYGYTDIELFF